MAPVLKVALSVSELVASTRYAIGVRTRTSSYFENQLVDTKSVNNTTLLHFLERTVAKQFPEMEEFLIELEKPAEAYRGGQSGWSCVRHGFMRQLYLSQPSGCSQRTC
jgi:hypothetical protein